MKQINKRIGILFWLRVFSSYFLILFSFDLVARLKYLNQAMQINGIIASIAGNIIGLLMIALILAIIFDAITGYFKKRRMYYWRRTTILFVGGVMFFYFMVFIALCFIRNFEYFNSFEIRKTLWCVYSLAFLLTTWIAIKNKQLFQCIWLKRLIIPLKYLMTILFISILIVLANMEINQREQKLYRHKQRP